METNLTKDNATAARRSAPRAKLAPRVDVFENGHEFLVVAEMPGADKESIHVGLEGGELSLSAVRPYPVGTDAQRAGLEAEYARAFSMPDTIDGDKVEAEYTGGILRVKLPKRPEVKARRITVKAS